mgnify:CR=1 FL=1
MSYHPIIGISIFLISIVIAFILGRKFIKRETQTNNIKIISNKKLKKTIPPKGDITSPDAPWLKDT